MSRRNRTKSRSKSSRPNDRADGVAGAEDERSSESHAEPLASTPAPDSASHARNLLFLAIIGTVIWWIALAAMALLTSNPITLNGEQIRRSEYVVTAVVDDSDQRTISVEKEWKKNFAIETMTIENLPETGAKRSEIYLFPVSKHETGYFVTPSDLPNGAPLIYPAQDEAIEQLERILRQRDNGPANE